MSQQMVTQFIDLWIAGREAKEEEKKEDKKG